MFISRISTILLVGLLSACGMMHTTPDPAKEAAKKTKSALVNTQLGLTYLQNNQMQAAKQKLLLALEEAPEKPEPWYSMAYYFEATGDRMKANQYYLKALAIAPTNGEVQNNYGTYLCRSGEYQNAIHHFLSAVEDNHYLDSASAYENAGLCALKIPNKKLAIAYFNRALLQDPNMATSLIELAQNDYEQKNYASAKEKLRQFLTISAPTEQSLKLSDALGQRVGYLKTADNSLINPPNTEL